MDGLFTKDLTNCISHEQGQFSWKVTPGCLSHAQHQVENFGLKCLFGNFIYLFSAILDSNNSVMTQQAYAEHGTMACAVMGTIEY